MSFLLDHGESIYVEYTTHPATMRYSHVHPQYEMYFCLHAIPQSLVINGHEYRCDEPCVIISAPFTIHAMSPLEKRVFERIVVYFGDRTVSAVDERLLPKEFLERSMGYLFRLDEASASLLRRTINPLLDGSDHRNEAEKELRFLLFLHKLFDLCDPQNVTEVGGKDFYIQHVLRYIVEHVGEVPNLEALAEQFAVSRSKLDRDFKRCTGCTTHAFVDACRLNHAKTLLLRRDGHVSMEEIATSCGFFSETYFYSFFRRHTGMSPGEYRREGLHGLCHGEHFGCDDCTFETL